MLQIAFIGLICSIFSLAAKADPKPKPVAVQQIRAIQNGLKEGQLTNKEARGLANEQLRIRKAAAAAKSDGKVTTEEQRVLEAQRARAAANIYLQRTDKQKTAERAEGDVRLFNQDFRIRSGRTSGDLTKDEAERLRKEQQLIESMVKAAKKGGINKQEEARIDALQDRSSANIYLQRHDEEAVDNTTISTPPIPNVQAPVGEVQTQSYDSQSVDAAGGVQ